MRGNDSTRSAFTLLEILVSMAVLVLVFGLLVQVFGGTMGATRDANRKMEGRGEARAVLDALNGDLLHLVTQQKMTVFVRQDGENSELVLLTLGRGSESDARCMSVAYRLSGEGTVVRYTRPVLWSDHALANLAVSTSSSSASSVVAKGIVRFEAVAVLADGTIAPIGAAPSWNDTVIDGQTLGNGFVGLNLVDTQAPRKCVSALIVGLVGADERSYRVVQDAGKLGKVAAAFPSPLAGQTPMDAWEGVLTSGALSVAPPAVAPLIQAFQYTYSLK